MAKQMKSKKKAKKKSARPRCGLCGKSKKLMRTDCCGQWICNDEDQYVLFSYAHNSCARNHRRYTLCSYHHTENHPGDWKTCPLCRESFKTEMYVYYGTNDYNFEKLEDPPEYEPTRCAGCGAVISLTDDPYTWKGGQYFCTDCIDIPWLEA